MSDAYQDAQEKDYEHELARLQAEDERELAARRKSYDMHGGDHASPLEQPMPTIITQFGEWAVTPFGVECLVYPYQIQWDSLTDPTTTDEFWLKNLSRKEWVNLRDFTEAMRHGRRIHHYLQGVGDNNILE